MTTPDPLFVAAMRAMHDTLFEGNENYRRLICATPEANTEGAVYIDEMEALTCVRKIAVTAHSTSGDDHTIAISKHLAQSSLALLSDALHAVLLADGLGGSLEAGQRHVAIVKAEIQQANYESMTRRRAMHDLPPLSS